MPGLVPGIHVLCFDKGKTWMAGTSPAMTVGKYLFQALSREVAPDQAGTEWLAG
jgi:hypothetical protein